MRKQQLKSIHEQKVLHSCRAFCNHIISIAELFIKKLKVSAASPIYFTTQDTAIV